MDTTPPKDMAAMGGYVGKTLYKTLAEFLQYIIPIACLIGATLSVLARRKRGELFARAATQPAQDPLNTMTWPEFEILVGESFRRQGYAVTEVGGKNADGGVDLVLTRDGQTFLVQCKHWKAYKAGVNVVRELFGVMAAEKAAGGFVVTSGSFTQESQAFAKGKNIVLIDGPRLIGMIRGARQMQQATPAMEAISSDILCPKCGEIMVRRVAKQGAGSGTAFWGCKRFPKCRGTRPIN